MESNSEDYLNFYIYIKILNSLNNGINELNFKTIAKMG